MCGVAGTLGVEEAAKEAFLGLITLQHRGQDAAGILSYDGSGFHTIKGLGLVESVFDREHMAQLPGMAAVAHTRYSTIGPSGAAGVAEVQPFLLSYPFGIALAHNGQLINTEDLKQGLRARRRRHLLTASDSEVLLNVFADRLAEVTHESGASEEPRFEERVQELREAVRSVYDTVDGSYSIVVYIAGYGLLAFRDPRGIRPLVWGRKKGGALASGEAHMVASESVALTFNGYTQYEDLKAGEFLFISEHEGRIHREVLTTPGARPCMFEWVYFASAESVLDGRSVYRARIGLGRALAANVKKAIEERGLKPDMVVPVPESARLAAIALSESLQVPYREVLIKNRYIKRTFILGRASKRKEAVGLKLAPVRSEIEGKRVLLVDDSIVRGTTSIQLISLLRAAGAKEVYFVSGCPPIQSPCYYGIDFPDAEELLAHGRTHAEIEKTLGADAVIYQDIEGLQRALQDASLTEPSTAEKFSPCTACLDGNYPTRIDGAETLSTLRKRHRQGAGA